MDRIRVRVIDRISGGVNREIIYEYEYEDGRGEDFFKSLLPLSLSDKAENNIRSEKEREEGSSKIQPLTTKREFSKEKKVGVKVKQEEEKKENLTVKIPSVEETISYISSNSEQNFVHNTHTIHQHFFGKLLGCRGKDKFAYDRMCKILAEAHKKIAERYDGEWHFEWKSLGGKRRYKIYKFVKMKKQEQKQRSTQRTEKEPMVENIESYIESYTLKKNPHYVTIPEIAKHFYGRRIYLKNDEKRPYWRLYNRFREAKDRITEKYKGHWERIPYVPKDEKRYIIYEFVFDKE